MSHIISTLRFTLSENFTPSPARNLTGGFATYGQVKVFEWTGTYWQLRGSVIPGIDDFDELVHTFTETGIYTGLFTAVSGCDSLVTRHLTINKGYNLTKDVEACNSYTFDGNALTSSGIYQGTFTTASGCEGVINPPSKKFLRTFSSTSFGMSARSQKLSAGIRSL